MVLTVKFLTGSTGINNLVSLHIGGAGIGALAEAGGAMIISKETAIGAGGLQLKVVFDKRHLYARLYLLGNKFIIAATKNNQKIEWGQHKCLI